jgi:hypothetical protein
MRSIGAEVNRIENALPVGLFFAGANLPRQQPREVDAVRIHVGDEVGVVAVVPEDVLVGVDEHSDRKDIVSFGVVARAAREKKPRDIARGSIG